MQLTVYGEIPGQTAGPLTARAGTAPSSIWLGMKLTAILLLAVFLQVSANGLSQSISLNVKKVSLEKVMAEIERQSGYHFLYTVNELSKSKAVSLNLSNVDLITALAACFQDQPIQYSVVDNNIILSVQPAESSGLISNFLHLFSPSSPPVKFKGKVVNEQGKPLEDASIQVKGTSRHTYADRNGIFEIDGVTIGTTLVISYPGFSPVEFVVKSLETPAGADKVLPTGVKVLILLQPSKTGLDEMQVIGYGRVSKRLNTGSVVTIKAEDIEKNPVSNVLEALQGHVPGMFIQQASGNPGSNFTIQIRGQSSFGLNAPLFVVDGVVYPANQALPMINPVLNPYKGTISPFNGGNALNYFDPSLIESVEILKDADATSIYGSRGAYGVILITTKKGKAGAPRLSVNASSGLTERGVSPKLLNTQQYLALRREALNNDNQAVGAYDYDINGTWDSTRDVNWDKAFVGHGSTNTLSATYSGGIGTNTYLIQANYNRLNSITRGGGAQNSGGMHFNIGTGSLNQKFTVNLDGSFSTTVNDMLPVDFIGIGSQYAPNFPDFIRSNGEFNWDYISGQSSPVSQKLTKYHGVTNNLTSTATLIYKPVRGLTINATVGYNLLTGREINAYPSTYVNPEIYTNPSLLAQSNLASYTNSTVNFDPVAVYTTHLGSKGRLEATAGMDMQSSQSNNYSIIGTGFPTDATLLNPTLGTTVASGYSTTPNRQLGYISRLNYVWDQKYGIDLTGRYDGSTKFGPRTQFGSFGAVGAMWIFSDEHWVKENLPFLSYGKLRGSYGTTGGDGISNYAYLSTYTISNNSYQGGSRLVTSSLANPYLQWEKNKKLDGGIEMHFLSERIWIEADYYVQRTTNQLISQPLATITGFGGITQNSPALIQNKGVEANLKTVNIQSKKFSWTTTFNVTVNRNKLLAYPNAKPGDALPIGFNYIIGKSLQNIKLYNYVGVDPATGVYFYKNAKGETGSFEPFFTSGLSATDKTINKDLQPHYYGGIDNTITYKGFSLNFFFSITSRLGQNEWGQQQIIPGGLNINPTTIWLNRWQKPGDKAPLPRVTQDGFDPIFQVTNFHGSTGAYSDATYARLQNASITYTFQPSFLKKAKISGLSVYVRGQNLLTISKYKNLDPENLSAGAMGPLRIITGGLNITL